MSKSKLFSKFTLRPPKGQLDLPNRLVIAPMCQYSAESGNATNWHLYHWTNLLHSGAGALIIEATGVNLQGRISNQCLALATDENQYSIHTKIHQAKEISPNIPILIQLAHAGRKASVDVPWKHGKQLDLSSNGWETCSSTASPFHHGDRPPKELSKIELKQIREDFVQAAKRVKTMGLDGIEVHSAHGYLLHQFLSPVVNKRTDEYGGSLMNRLRFPLEIIESIRSVFDGVVGVRISATDWLDDGWDVSESVEYTHKIKALGCDYIHVSSGGLSPDQKIRIGANYQIPFAKKIKAEVGLTTIGVGLITEPKQAEDILGSDDCDLVALGRAFLYRPRWGLEAAAELGGRVETSPQYISILNKFNNAVTIRK